MVIASSAIGDTWTGGTSRGFDFLNVGSENEGFKIVCDSDEERNGSYVEVLTEGLNANSDEDYRVEFGSRSFAVTPSPTLILFAKKLGDQERYDLLDAYASSPMVRVYRGDDKLLELDLGSDRPALCL